MSLCVFALIASEFMPVSLLTPIASELGLTEGQAGQAIAISGAFAVLTSLFISSLAGHLDRKVLLLALTGVMAVSGTIVAVAPNYEILMVGRVLIGVIIGGFWSMSAATAILPADAGRPDPNSARAISFDQQQRLVHAIAEARAWLREIAKYGDTKMIATQVGRSERSVRMGLSLAFLAPDIVQSILDRTLPRTIGLSRLAELPMLWADQRRALGLSSN